VHFKHFAPELPYAIKRYQFEAERHYAILEARLATRRYMLGDIYTIVDMSLWGWARVVPFVLGPQRWEKHPSVKRWYDEIVARPAAIRVESLRTQHPYKTEMDAEARRHMFRHTIEA
jgi:GSH-dependent disulfide-bond oxidoreductase